MPCRGKHREFVSFAITLGNLFAQVVNSLILKILRYFPQNIDFFPLETQCGCQTSFVYETVANHCHRENLHLDLLGKLGKIRKFEILVRLLHSR